MTEDIDLRGARILIVDDQPANLEVLGRALHDEGFEALAVSNGYDAIQVAKDAEPELILLDVMMPDMDGFETCRRLKQIANLRDVPVIFITAKDDMRSLVQGFKAGGVDYILKPFRSEEVLARAEAQLKIGRLTRELKSEIEQRKTLSEQKGQLADRLSHLSHEDSERWGVEGFIGKSELLRSILDEIRLLRKSATTSVLITGESGTGKELIARAIHKVSSEPDAPFLPVNCSAIPQELADSLFFGHKKGTFTGAEGDRRGYFELADGGTLFLDEVGDMPLDLQAKLLRTLEDGRILPIGSTQEKQVNVRVVAATNADLQGCISEGRFRQDLYYRLARYQVTAPPLRDRREDIPLLAQHFVSMFAKEMVVQPTPLDDDIAELLKSYDFPGNVRELKNVIERAMIQSGGGAIRPDHVQLPRGAVAPSAAPQATGEGPCSVDDLPYNLKKAELMLIHRAMDAAGGNIAEASRLLGIHRAMIYRKLAAAQELSG